MHKSVADKMVTQGGLLCDFPSRTEPDRQNFPQRNRVVAGLADATVVVETKTKGGSMITAEIANSYDRDVFAVPGNINSSQSEGCNYLIKTHRAILLDNTQELIETLGWSDSSTRKPVQKQLFIDLTEDERSIT
jgi:DNA processing protein